MYLLQANGIKLLYTTFEHSSMIELQPCKGQSPNMIGIIYLTATIIFQHYSANGTSPTQISFTAQNEQKATQNEQEVHFDELGKSTQESEEVCTRLIEQLQSRLEENPNNVGLLWRISRALTHLSMHKQKQEETEEEKQLLQQGVLSL